jgi:para-aminobenzoate synthetase component 1
MGSRAFRPPSRTFVVRDGKVSVQAGAGVVFDSVPQREYRETLEKADALFRALHLADGGASPDHVSEMEAQR